MENKNMTKEQHKERHIMLHKHFDELMADFMRHNPEKLPSETSLMELAKWSNEQTENPTVDKRESQYVVSS